MADQAQGRTGGGTVAGDEAGADSMVEQGQQKAREVKQQAKETAQELKAEGKHKAEELKSEGKQKAKELKSQGKAAAREAKHRAEEQVDRQSTVAADHLDSVVRAFQSAADTLDNDGEAWLADYSRKAAGQVDRATGYLRDNDSRAMARDLERSARSHPVAFIGTAMAAGLALGRFFRSSAPEPDMPDTRSSRGAGTLGDRPGYSRTGMAGAAGAIGGADLDLGRGGVSTGGSAIASRAAGGAATSGAFAESETDDRGRETGDRPS